MESAPTQSQTLVGGGDIISRMKAKNRNILILYGSQTGTAEDFASTLAKEAQVRITYSFLIQFLYFWPSLLIFF